MPRLRVSRPGVREYEPQPDPAGAEPRPEPRPATWQQPESPAMPPTAGAPLMSREDRELIETVQKHLVGESDTGKHRKDPEFYARRIGQLVTEQLEKSGRILPDRERNRLIRQAQSELLGLGPLEELLADETVSEIMVNGPHLIYVERAGRLHETDLHFADEEHVRRIIDRIISPLGRRCDETTPMVDARLPDGSRVNAIIPPLALNGSTITIRKFSRKPLTAQDLVNRGATSPEMMEFLRACVLGRLNIIVSGGTGTGKTTLLNVLSSFIPEDERIVTIENAAELQLMQRHVVTLESRPPNIEGRGEVSLRDLMVNSLRMRPDRIVVGECRAGEALDMLQAMNTGHDGSLTTLHANSPRDALRRMETMCLMAGMDLPLRAIREQVASAVDVIIQLERMKDGTRRITHLCEVTGMENDVVSMSDIFVFQHQGVRDGQILGRIVPTGIRPRFLERLQQSNITMSPQVFGNGVPGMRL
jgi:pilus assembly protein CpaF